jgi:hypothetical protein
LILWGIAKGIVVRRQETTRWCGVLLLAAVALAIQSKFFDYHHIVLFPILALGFGLPFIDDPRVSSGTTAKQPFRILFVSAIAILFTAASITIAGRLGPVWSAAGQVAQIKMPQGPRPANLGVQGDLEIALMIRALSRPDERIFVWGTRPLLYFMSERPVAGPYTHMIHMAPPWGPAEHRIERLMLRLNRERPRLVIVCPNDWEWWCNLNAGQLLDRSPDMREFILDNYERIRSINGCEIWSRKDP